MASSFGTLFRITSFGESHGGGVGVVVDGCPPRLPLNLAEIQADLDRRRPGQSAITTPRKEADQVEVLSGLLDGVTLGTPIAMVVRNKDQRPGDYSAMAPNLPPLPCRCHLPGQVRHPGPQRRRSRLGPGNHRPCGGWRHCPSVAASPAQHRSGGLGGAKSTTWWPRWTPPR